MSHNNNQRNASKKAELTFVPALEEPLDLCEGQATNAAEHRVSKCSRKASQEKQPAHQRTYLDGSSSPVFRARRLSLRRPASSLASDPRSRLAGAVACRCVDGKPLSSTNEKCLYKTRGGALPGGRRAMDGAAPQPPPPPRSEGNMPLLRLKCRRPAAPTPTAACKETRCCLVLLQGPPSPPARHDRQRPQQQQPHAQTRPELPAATSPESRTQPPPPRASTTPTTTTRRE